jgi:hypothetical protein
MSLSDAHETNLIGSLRVIFGKDRYERLKVDKTSRRATPNFGSFWQKKKTYSFLREAELRGLGLAPGKTH